MSIVRHNLTALNANRQLGIVAGEKAKASEKLSSGYKINRSADDAAGRTIHASSSKPIQTGYFEIEVIWWGVTAYKTRTGQ